MWLIRVPISEPFRFFTSFHFILPLIIAALPSLVGPRPALASLRGGSRSGVLTDHRVVHAVQGENFRSNYRHKHTEKQNSSKTD